MILVSFFLVFMVVFFLCLVVFFVCFFLEQESILSVLSYNYFSIYQLIKNDLNTCEKN